MSSPKFQNYNQPVGHLGKLVSEVCETSLCKTTQKTFKNSLISLLFPHNPICRTHRAICSVGNQLGTNRKSIGNQLEINWKSIILPSGEIPAASSPVRPMSIRWELWQSPRASKIMTRNPTSSNPPPPGSH